MISTTVKCPCGSSLTVEYAADPHRIRFAAEDAGWSHHDTTATVVDLCPKCTADRNGRIAREFEANQVVELEAAADAVNHNRHLSHLSGSAFLAAAVWHNENAGQCTGDCDEEREAANVLAADLKAVA